MRPPAPFWYILTVIFAHSFRNDDTFLPCIEHGIEPEWDVAGNAVASGDTIYLKTHTGKHIDVEGTAVQARWNDQGDWQALTIEKAGVRLVGACQGVYIRVQRKVQV